MFCGWISPSLQCLLSRCSVTCRSKWQLLNGNIASQDEASSRCRGSPAPWLSQILHRPVHLVGHSTGGLLGATVCASISRNSQVFNPIRCGYLFVDWQAHYYVHRQVLSRQEILTAMVYNLFGYQNKHTIKRLVSLERDLDCSLTSLAVSTAECASRQSCSFDGLR